MQNHEPVLQLNDTGMNLMSLASSFRDVPELKLGCSQVQFDKCSDKQTA